MPNRTDRIRNLLPSSEVKVDNTNQGVDEITSRADPPPKHTLKHIISIWRLIVKTSARSRLLTISNAFHSNAYLFVLWQWASSRSNPSNQWIDSTTKGSFDLSNQIYSPSSNHQQKADVTLLTPTDYRFDNFLQTKGRTAASKDTTTSAIFQVNIPKATVSGHPIPKLLSQVRMNTTLAETSSKKPRVNRGDLPFNLMM